MELAFIKGLKHVLSDKYSYLIVADRGFGNQRFTKLCLDNGFDYLIRVKGNLLTKFTDKNESKIDKLENIQTNKMDVKNLKIYSLILGIEKKLYSSYLKKMTLIIT